MTDTPETTTEISLQHMMGHSPPNLNKLCEKMERERNAAYALLVRCRELTGYSLPLRADIDAIISSENV